MSVTFFSPDAPEYDVPEPCFCNGETEDGELPCPHCRGTGEVVVKEREGEFNLSNGSAAALVRLLDLPNDDPECGPVGVLTPDQYPVVLRRIIEASNTAAFKKEVRPATVSGNFYDGGMDSDRILRILDRFQTLIRLAQENSWNTITWG